MKQAKKDQPLISILMPVYNAERFLADAVTSIIRQTYPRWELIAIDDGSRDNSLKILKKYKELDPRIKILHFKRNKGLARALNVALKKTKGTFIARMDADDISFPSRLKKQLAYLQHHKNLVAVGCQVDLINEEGVVFGQKAFPQDPKKLYKMMMEMMPIQHPTLLTYTKFMKKSIYENHTTAEDVTMFFKLVRFGDFGNVPDVLFQYRVYPTSNSLKDPKKTFFLTFRARIKGITRWGYKPSFKGMIVNILQFIIVSLLPSKTILALYEMMRFRRTLTLWEMVTSARAVSK